MTLATKLSSRMRKEIERKDKRITPKQNTIHLSIFKQYSTHLNINQKKILKQNVDTKSNVSEETKVADRFDFINPSSDLNTLAATPFAKLTSIRITRIFGLIQLDFNFACRELNDSIIVFFLMLVFFYAFAE